MNYEKNYKNCKNMYLNAFVFIPLNPIQIHIFYLKSNTFFNTFEYCHAI